MARSITDLSYKFLSHLKYAQTPQSVPERLIVGMTVYDPRLKYVISYIVYLLPDAHFPNRFPQKAAKLLSETDNGQGEPSSYLRFMQPSASLAESPLWDEQTRDGLLKPRYRKADLDKRRQAVSGR